MVGGGALKVDCFLVLFILVFDIVVFIVSVVVLECVVCGGVGTCV